MTRIEWRPEFSTGIAEVDHEHRALIDLINGTLALCTAALAGRREIEQGLGEIYARTTAHFALEERLMEHVR
jgi:hemerythrin-like metal-binding protein